MIDPKELLKKMKVVSDHIVGDMPTKSIADIDAMLRSPNISFTRIHAVKKPPA